MATACDGSITPPPPVGIRTPPTPRLGYHDNWEPFTPRKSARLSQQRARTPSPNGSRIKPQSPRTVKKSSKQAAASPMPSPTKKRQPAMDAVRRASASLTAESSHAASALGLDKSSSLRPTRSSASLVGGMLPTPSKTPQKPPNEKTTTKIKSIARNLFPSQAEADVMPPSPKKRRAKKYTGISLESFTAEDIEEPIEIFTDSQDRIPSRDTRGSNPFYGDAAAAPEPPRRRSKRRQVNIPGEGVKTIDEASSREDGMVYVFRGKKFFRKFSDLDNEDLEELEDEENSEEARLARPLTRSSIKPRLLFQAAKTQQMIDEEEAATDVEEDVEEEQTEEEAEIPEMPVPQTPAKRRVSKHAATPEAPKFAPVSPPDTRRTTRSTNKLVDTPIKGRSKSSPFDSWRRTKEHKASGAQKRHAESLTSESAKRTRT